MACPKCGCKTTYTYVEDDILGQPDDQERCAACGHIFYVEDHAEEDDDEDTGALSSRPPGWGLVPDFEQVA